MNVFHAIGSCLIVAFLIVLPASAAELSGGANQTINNEFAVMLPSDWSNFPINTFAGQAAGLMDNTDTTTVIGVQIYNNTNCSEKMEENLAVNLDLFNAKGGVANLSAPVYGMDSVNERGKGNDGLFTNVYLRLVNGSVIAVFATYETPEDADKKADIFSSIAESVTALNPVSNDFCSAENTKPTPAPTATYKPRPVPTVKNTVMPTEVPTEVPNV